MQYSVYTDTLTMIARYDASTHSNSIATRTVCTQGLLAFWRLGICMVHSRSPRRPIRCACQQHCCHGPLCPGHVCKQKPSVCRGRQSGALLQVRRYAEVSSDRLLIPRLRGLHTVSTALTSVLNSDPSYSHRTVDRSFP